VRGVFQQLQVNGKGQGGAGGSQHLAQPDQIVVGGGRVSAVPAPRFDVGDVLGGGQSQDVLLGDLVAGQTFQNSFLRVALESQFLDVFAITLQQFGSVAPLPTGSPRARCWSNSASRRRIHSVASWRRSNVSDSEWMH